MPSEIAKCALCRKPITGFADGYRMIRLHGIIQMVHVACDRREEPEEEQGRDLTKDIIDTEPDF